MIYHQIVESSELGGAGSLCRQLAHSLLKTGLSSRIWFPCSGPAVDEASRLGIPIGYYDAKWAIDSSIIKAWCANWKVGTTLRKSGAGLVHIHSPSHYGALRRGLQRSKLVRVVHVQLEDGAELLQWAFRHPPELIVTCAKFLVDYLRRILPAETIRRTRIESVPNAVDTERFQPGDCAAAKQRVDAPAGAPLALMLANLSPHKGQETAIRTAAELKSRGVDVRFWLAGYERGGSTSYTTRLKSLIREHGVADRVTLLGQRSDSPDLLRAADFFLLPSTCEGLPISLLEAQATGVPVLASPTAGVPEVVRHGETGFLIAAGDAEGYANHLARLVEYPELRARTADAALRQVRNEYNWTAFCRRILSLYDDLGPDRRAGSRDRSGVIRP